MTDTLLLEDKITKSGLKKLYIAQKIGISAFALAKKMRNENEFKAGEIGALCAILDISDIEEKERIFFAHKVDLQSTI